MAELIDKNGAIKLIEKEFDMNCLTEWGQGYIDAMKDVKGIIALLPTTTEAEIRAKAIGVMGMAMKEYYPSCKGAYVDFDVFFHAVMARVAEQLKEE